WEIQPSARLGWTISSNQVLWGAVSRAVRSPSRAETDLDAPTADTGDLSGALLHNRDYSAEELLAFELGYRVRPAERISLSLASYYNFYDKLGSLNQINPTTLQLRNDFKGETWGFELMAEVKATEWWRLRGGYDYLHKHLSATLAGVLPEATAGNDPQNVFKIQSIMNFPGFLGNKDQFQFDVTGRYYDTLPSPNVPSYFSCDVRIAWDYKNQFELALVGQNLADNRHPEFGAPLVRKEIPRSVYGKVTWKF
ncbi:MAG TPA: TonB-dependent receptor, partial [Candidatus Saccharimonadales bacterium]|nr:TonB-dependent receptor [Candidatus Saccharimonadales bacterium]